LKDQPGKTISITQTDLKLKFIIKTMGIKIEYKTNFIFDWRVNLIKKKNQLNLRIKRLRILIKIKNKNKFLIEGWTLKEKLI
jgi:hypothetical protein